MKLRMLLQEQKPNVLWLAYLYGDGGYIDEYIGVIKASSEEEARAKLPKEYREEDEGYVGVKKINSSNIAQLKLKTKKELDFAKKQYDVFNKIIE